MSEVSDKIKKQVEYYFSDKNLEHDAFFHNKISADKEGWVDLDFVMNCNKIKDLTKDPEVVVSALEGSTVVETDKGMPLINHLSYLFNVLGGIRRIGNKELPKLILKQKKETHKEEDEKDSGEITERDFKDPKIIEYKVDADGEAKPSWRDLEKSIVAKYPTLKILYSRMEAEEKTGQIAFSSRRLNTEVIDSLIKDKITSEGFDYEFSQPSDDALKKFWEKHGSHYEMCTKQKLRRINKQKKIDNADKSHKRQKLEEEERSHTIAGVTYANINKVKSKAKAIMNVKDDGQKLEGYEEEFMKELLKCHPKHDDKMKDFSHFVVDEHPSFSNTR